MIKCPKCGSEYGYSDGTAYNCPECFHIWTEADLEKELEAKKKFDSVGNELNEGAEFCSKCGSAVAAGSSASIQQSNSENHRVNNGDAPSGGFAFLGFLFPLVGLILYLVWRE